jgi:hypothetical protein
MGVANDHIGVVNMYFQLRNSSLPKSFPVHRSSSSIVLLPTCLVTSFSDRRMDAHFLRQNESSCDCLQADKHALRCHREVLLAFSLSFTVSWEKKRRMTTVREGSQLAVFMVSANTFDLPVNYSALYTGSCFILELF